MRERSNGRKFYKSNEFISTTGNNIQNRQNSENQKVIDLINEELNIEIIKQMDLNNLSEELKREMANDELEKCSEDSSIEIPHQMRVVNLKDLKELTNTPLGGRGTFPNGPDVLAINVYKVTGADINSNIIIKWGEAQA